MMKVLDSYMNGVVTYKSAATSLKSTMMLSTFTKMAWMSSDMEL